MTAAQQKKIDRVLDLLGDASAHLDDLENDETLSETDRETFHEAWESVYESIVMLARFEKK